MTLVYSINTSAQTIQKILDNGSDNQLINLVIMGDGYMSSEQSKLETDANIMMNELFAESPFKEYKSLFNVHLISTISVDSGADHPATDIHHDTLVNGQLLFPVQTVNTAYNSTYDFKPQGSVEIHRLLVPQDDAAILTDLMNLIPYYDQVLMLVNQDEYGGSGGDIATSSTFPGASDVAIHEIGHSFAGLGDEYYAGDEFFFEKPNMTMDDNEATNKWKEWLGLNGISIDQYYCLPTVNCDTGNFIDYPDWYKPTSHACMMEITGAPYCSVCKEAIIETIYDLVGDPFLSRAPANPSPAITNGQNRTFSTDIAYPSPNTIIIEWYLNGSKIIGRTTDSEVFNYSDFIVGAPNELKMVVYDETTLSKAYLPNQGYEFSSTWNVNVIDNCGTTHSIAIDNYSEPFNLGCCTTQPTSDDIDWQLGTSTTPTTGTGPKAGFVFEDVDDGTEQFLYIEGDLGSKLEAVYKTDCFDLTDIDHPQFELRYVMDGDDVELLDVLVQTQANSAPISITRISGDQGNAGWRRLLIDLEDYVGSSFIRFYILGVTGTTPLSDIAIDHIRVFDKCDGSITLPKTRDHRTIFDFDVDDYIKSSAIVHSSGEVIYNAKDSIILDVDFRVNTNGIFEVYNDGCE